MNEERNLKVYLMRSFLLTLLFIGLSQVLISLILDAAMVPWLEDRLGLNGLLSGAGAGGIITVMFRCLLITIIRNATYSASVWTQRFGELSINSIFGGKFASFIESLNRQLNDTDLSLLMMRIILLLFVMTIIWMLPYLVGGLIFTKVVTKKVRELEQKRMERDREYERRRSLLLSDVAHDIKTPITTVAGFSRALADGAVPEEQKQDYLNAVYNKSMRVSDLVTLLFEYVKLDSEGFMLHKARENFSEMIRECIAGSYADFEEKNMTPELQIAEEDLWVQADKMQLDRAINNLLTNTVRHNPEGTRVFIEADAEDGYAVFRISDCGVFIDREAAVHLFDPFVQVDTSRKSSAGSGLGLSISKKIVEMHDGQIRLVQYKDPEKYGKVKSFEIKLPIL